MKYYVRNRLAPIAMKTLRGDLIKIFPNMTAASKETKVPVSAISGVCNGMNNSAGGYKWEKVIENKT